MNIIKKRYITGYAVFSLFFFLALFAFTILSIQNMTITNREEAEKNFMEVRNNVVIAFSESGNLGSGGMEKVFDSVKKNQRLLALVLYSTEKGILKVKARDSFYIKNFKSEADAKSFTLEYNNSPGTWTSELPISLRYANMEIDAYLSGLYVILGSKDYTVLLWNVLYILLGFLLLTILAMLFLSNRAKVENEKSFTVPSGESRKSAQNRPAVQQIIPAADEAVEAPEPPYDFAEVVLPELESAFPAETFPAPEEVLEEASPFAAETSGFSPVTRLGSPQNFLNRLRFELERAASFDQDLAIAVLDIRGGGGKSDKSRRQLGELVLKHFPFQDLAFEYSPSRFVIIIPEQSKEQALNKVKILGNEAGEMHISLGMGLSARGTRVVDAENLFSEAVDALETGESHAQKQGAVHSGDEADS